MISHIDIKDFAIVKDLSFDLYPGLNIITGETGAGKSVVIEAISMALGARADSDYIRRGADKAVISMLIDTEDNQYVIKREIAPGKSLCRINGELVSLSELSRLCDGLVDIHGQYDQQSLLNPANHINILDLYGGRDLADVKRMTADFYGQYAEASSKLLALRKYLADSARQKDFLKFELDEITAANIKPGEDEELAERIKLMEKSEDIYSALGRANEELFSGDAAAYSVLGNAVSALADIKGCSAELDTLIQRIDDVYYELEDIKPNLRSSRDSVSFSPEELDEAIERQDILNKLKKKYGGSLEAVLLYAEDAARQLETIENADEEMQQLENEISMRRKEYDAAAARLSRLRKDAAYRLETGINKELAELNFRNAVFSVNIKDEPGRENGKDLVEFLISTNPGEELKPLAKIVSGGELSRIMLALKHIIGDIDGIPSMIFDEIDAGVAGATAGVVGEKLRAISKNRQIICITHLPQIAAMGDHHFRIEKSSDEHSTQAAMVALSEEERIEELARLLSGTHVTDTAREQAKELLSR